MAFRRTPSSCGKEKYMKTFNDLHVGDVMYIITEYDQVIICRISKLFKMTDVHGNCTMTVTYKYAENRTNRDKEFEFKVNMSMMSDSGELMIFKNDSMKSYTIYLNQENLMNEIDFRIKNLNNQRDNVISFCKKM
jgi:hypothetical protein